MRVRYCHFKTAMDYLGSVVGLVLLSPLFLLIAILIKLDSPGPVFYTQSRVGKGGKIFRIWKFRSMRDDAEDGSGAVWAQKNDSRITRVGDILRRTHLDEVPQLWNVLRGEMSIIGPRPERPEFVATLSEEVKDYQERLQIKPGLTGLAQVHQKYDETLRDVRRKVRYDLIYIQHACLLLDIKIAALTLKKMVYQVEP